MISANCVDLHIAWAESLEGQIAKLTWNLCECCNFTQLRLYKRRLIGPPPDVGTAPPFYIQKVSRLFSVGWIPTWIFNPGNTTWRVGEVDSIDISDQDWYLSCGYEYDQWTFQHYFSWDVALAARCANRRFWMFSPIWHIKFDLGDPIWNPPVYFGYSATDPPPPI